jgi:tripartite-type tricarboxylate transporter receptor subunit TctC
MKMQNRGLRAVWAMAALVSGMSLMAGAAMAQQSVADFYKGKTITYITTGGPGGSYDTRTRIMSRHLGKHIPGNPNIVVQNMVSAGSITAMNHMYNVAPKDGTVICMTQRIIFSTPWLAPDGVQLDKYPWLGNVGSDAGIIMTWHDTPIQKADDLFTKEMIVAGTGPGTIPVVLNALVGMKFKVITGYKGSADMALAMERGEVMGPGEASWSDIKTSREDWLRDKKIRLILQNGLTKAKDLPDVPLSRDYVKNPDDLKIFDVFMTQRQLSYPILMTPGTPPDRVAALRKAFMDLGNDAEFKAEFDKLNLEFDLMPGQEMQGIVQNIVDMPKPLVDRFKGLMAVK